MLYNSTCARGTVQHDRRDFPTITPFVVSTWHEVKLHSGRIPTPLQLFGRTRDQCMSVLSALSRPDEMSRREGWISGGRISCPSAILTYKSTVHVWCGL